MNRVLALAIVAGCSQPVQEGPLGQTIRQSAERNHVPRDLMVAIGHVEGGLRLSKIRLLRIDDDVPMAGIFELRHGAFNSLARGAELMQVDEDTLRIDTDLATEAGARVLYELGASEDSRTWREALMELSGYSDDRARSDYARRVLTVLHDGGRLPARDGEMISLAAHPDLEVEPAGVLRQAAGETPDFAGATWFTTSCTNKCTPGRPDGNASVDIIIIHDTEGGWDASVSTLQFDGGKSVHYIVDADGKRVGQFRHETDTTWHAGNFEVNKHSVGIEHVGFASSAAGYATGEYEKSVELVKSIRSRWKVPLDRAHIYGHYQVANGNTIGESAPPCSAQLDTCETSPDYGGAGNHRDPGYHWDWCQYMERLGGHCECADAWPLWNCTTDHTEAVRCTNGKVEIDHCTAGCDSMAVGTNDVCNQTTQPSMPPSMPPDPSTPPPSMPPAKEPVTSAAVGSGLWREHSSTVGSESEGGCNVGGGSDGLFFVLIALAARSRAARAFVRSLARRRQVSR